MPSNINGISVAGENPLLNLNYSRTYCLEVIAWLANYAYGQPPGGASLPPKATVVNIDLAVRTLKKAGIWQKLDFFYYHATPTGSGGLAIVDMVTGLYASGSNRYFDVQGQLSTLPGYGLQGNGNGYILNISGGVKMTTNSCSFGHWVQNRMGGTTRLLSADGNNYQYRYIYFQSNNTASGYGLGDYNSVNNVQVNSPGFYAVANDGNTGQYYPASGLDPRNGSDGQRYVSIGNGNGTDGQNYILYMLSQSSPTVVPITWGGSYLTRSEMAIMHNTLKTLLSNNKVI